MTQRKSNEEIHFDEWLEEAYDMGLVSWYYYEPKSFELLPKQKCGGKFLFHPTTYTPDYVIHFTDLGMMALKLPPREGIKIYHPRAKEDRYVFWVDIKGSYDPFRKDDRFINIIRKLMYLKHKIFVKIFHLPDLFKQTWLPLSMQVTKKGRPSALSKKCLTAEQFKQRIGMQLEMFDDHSKT